MENEQKNALIKEYRSLQKIVEDRGMNTFRAKRIAEIEEELGLTKDQILKGDIHDIFDVGTC